MRFQTRRGLGLRSSSASRPPDSVAIVARHRRSTWGCRSGPACAAPAAVRSRRVRMISSFSDGRIPHSMSSPSAITLFLSRRFSRVSFGQRLLELARLGPQGLDLVGCRLARRVASEPLLAGLEELLRPAIVEVLGDAFLAAQLGDAVLAAQAFEHDADLLLGRELPPGGSADVPDGLLGALRRPLVSLSHRSPSRGYDEPEPLPYAISSICPVSADGGQFDVMANLTVLMFLRHAVHELLRIKSCASDAFAGNIGIRSLLEKAGRAICISAVGRLEHASDRIRRRLDVVVDAHVPAQVARRQTPIVGTDENGVAVYRRHPQAVRCTNDLGDRTAVAVVAALRRIPGDGCAVGILVAVRVSDIRRGGQDERADDRSCRCAATASRRRRAHDTCGKNHVRCPLALPAACARTRQGSATSVTVP